MPLETGELFDIHQRARLFLEFDVHHHVGAAGDDFGFRAVLGEHGQCLADRFRFEIVHNVCLFVDLIAASKFAFVLAQ